MQGFALTVLYGVASHRPAQVTGKTAVMTYLFSCALTCMYILSRATRDIPFQRGTTIKEEMEMMVSSRILEKLKHTPAQEIEIQCTTHRIAPTALADM